MVLRRGVAVMLPVAVLAGESEKFFAFRPGGADDGSKNEKARLLTTSEDAASLTLCVLGADNILTVPDDEKATFNCGSCNLEGAQYATQTACVNETGSFCLGNPAHDGSETNCKDENENPIWQTEYTFTAPTEGVAFTAQCAVGNGDSFSSATDENDCGQCTVSSATTRNGCSAINRQWTADPGSWTGTCSFGDDNVVFDANSEDECGYCKSTDLDDALKCYEHTLSRKFREPLEIDSSTCVDLDGNVVTDSGNNIFDTYEKCGICIGADSAHASGDLTHGACQDTDEQWISYYFFDIDSVAETELAGTHYAYLNSSGGSPKFCIPDTKKPHVFVQTACSTEGAEAYCELVSKTKTTCLAGDNTSWEEGNFTSQCVISGVDAGALSLMVSKSLCGQCNDSEIEYEEACTGTYAGEWTPGFFQESYTGKFYCPDTQDVADSASACSGICTKDGDITVTVSGVTTEDACVELGTQRCLNPAYTNKTACENGSNLWVNATWTEGLIVETTTTESGGIAVVVEEDDDSDCEASGGRSNLRGGGSLAAAAITALLTTVGAIFSSALVF